MNKSPTDDLLSFPDPDPSQVLRGDCPLLYALSESQEEGEPMAYKGPCPHKGRRWGGWQERGFDPPPRWSVLGEGLFKAEVGRGTAGFPEPDPKDRCPGIRAGCVLPGGEGNGRLSSP